MVEEPRHNMIRKIKLRKKTAEKKKRFVRKKTEEPKYVVEERPRKTVVNKLVFRVKNEDKSYS